MACRVATVAGTLVAGHGNGHGREALFNEPKEMALLADGSLLVADSGNHCIRKIDPYGIVSDYAGTPGIEGMHDGQKNSAQFNGPIGLCSTSDGSVIVADSRNNRIRKVGIFHRTTFTPLSHALFDSMQIDALGTVSTLASQPQADQEGEVAVQAPGCSSTYSRPVSVCADFYDDEEFLYVCDMNGLWKVSLDGDAIAIDHSDEFSSIPRGEVDVSSDNRLYSNLQQLCPLRMPDMKQRQSLVFVTDYVTDSIYHSFEQGTVWMMTGEQKITTMASSTWKDLNYQCTKVLLCVDGVAVDNCGCLYVSSAQHHYVAAISTVSTGRVGGLLAGKDKSGTDGMTDGVAGKATFRRPSRLLFDPTSHCLYVSQQHCVRKIMLPMRPQIPEQQQLHHLDKITDKGVGADVVFEVDRQLVHAIEALLCENSEYFQRMFASSMEESRAKKDKTPIKVEDTSYTALKAVVTWLMFEVMLMQADTPTETLIETLRLADRYLIQSLKDRCAALLMRRIDDGTTFRFLKLAEETRITFLKSKCIAFIVNNLQKMRKHHEFNEISHDVSMLILKLVNAKY